MQVHESLIELVGNTPLVRLRAVTKAVGGGQAPAVLAKVEYFNPGGSVEGPDRAADGGGGGGVRRAAPGRHHRGAHLRQHRGRPGHRGGAEGLPVRVRLPGQGRPGQDQRAAGLRRRGRGLPGHRVPRAPRLLLLGVQPAGPGDPGRLEAGPVRQPGEPGLALPLDRPGDLGPDGRPGHPLRGGHRHGRHHHRDRPVPQGGLRRPGPGDRGRPGGLGVLRRYRAALPGRGGGRGHVAGQLRPGRVRRGDGGQRRRVVPDDPQAGPRGGAAHRRVVRAGRGGRAARGRGRGARTM